MQKKARLFESGIDIAECDQGKLKARAILSTMFYKQNAWLYSQSQYDNTTHSSSFYHLVAPPVVEVQ